MADSPALIIRRAALLDKRRAERIEIDPVRAVVEGDPDMTAAMLPMIGQPWDQCAEWGLLIAHHTEHHAGTQHAVMLKPIDDRRVAFCGCGLILLSGYRYDRCGCGRTLEWCEPERHDGSKDA